jgi:hypothetical protein
MQFLGSVPLMFGFLAGLVCVNGSAHPLHAFADAAKLRKQRVHVTAIDLQVSFPGLRDAVELAGADRFDRGMTDLF